MHNSFQTLQFLTLAKSLEGVIWTVGDKRVFRLPPVAIWNQFKVTGGNLNWGVIWAVYTGSVQMEDVFRLLHRLFGKRLIARTHVRYTPSLCLTNLRSFAEITKELLVLLCIRRMHCFKPVCCFFQRGKVPNCRKGVSIITHKQFLPIDV